MSRVAVAVVLALAVLQAGEKKEPASVSISRRVEFPMGGSIRVANSFGDLTVEGWQHEEVSLEVVKRTAGAYAPARMLEALARLDAVRVEFALESENRLTLTTVAAPRKLFGMRLPGGSGIRLEYVLRVPWNCDLSVSHQTGRVRVLGVASNILVQARVGEVILKLPEDADFAVDARSAIGGVNSDFTGAASRRAHRVLVRVGIGEIDVHKLQQWVPVERPGAFLDN